MAPLSPTSTTILDIPSFGKVKGLEYGNGIRQFCGIPYATLSKRWTRAVLKTSLGDEVHDGTRHGPKSPQPPEYTSGPDPMVPVEPFPHFPPNAEHDLDCLNLNITTPPTHLKGPHPVMVWIHGGSFLFGASSHPAYDFVKLVSTSVDRGTPIIGVSVNYRVGLFGFLASKAIQDDLSRDGFSGAGNFGLTDQQTALKWVQRYVASVGGDPDNVTIFGESAGGMSVAHQIWAADPAPFHRGISMSGTLNTIAAWPLEKHEERWGALLRYLKIDPAASDALEQLRAIPWEEVAKATCPIEGVIGATGNPCADGCYHSVAPSVGQIASPPGWLKSYMAGDVRDEAMIFRWELADETYSSILSVMARYVDENVVQELLGDYDIQPDMDPNILRIRFEDVATDVMFVLQNWLHCQSSSIPQTYWYHMDQQSTLKTPLMGLAYHAIDLLYVFRNLEDQMTEGQIRLAEKVSGDFIDFAYGRDPWERFNVAGRSMVYGPDDSWAVKTEAEDGTWRRLELLKKIVDRGLLEKWMLAADVVCNHRLLLGKVNQ